jgi:anaerobic magnesium-protoporphyrin IX monomethyl ester cyclase
MKFTMLMLEIRSGVPGFSGSYSEGIASIAGVVKQARHEFELIHVTRPTTPEQLAERVARTKPDAVGYSCMTHTFPYLKAFAPAIKKALPNVPTLMGGVHAILNPQESIEVEGIDAVCLGEGESVMLPFLERIERGRSFEDVEGLFVNHDGRIHRNAATPLVVNLDSLPMPDRSVFDFSKLVTTREGVLYVFASRGCPYQCPFCSNHAIRSQAPNSKDYLRYKSVARVCEEIEIAASHFPGKLRGLYFQDEILTMNLAWFSEFANVYPQRIGIPFNCNLRADLVSERTADLLQKSGCNSVSIGLESGVERIRQVVVGKNITDAVFRQAFERLHVRGIGVNTFSMIGLPGETPADALETVFFNADTKVDKNMVSIFCPYPGTKLHKMAEDMGILSPRMPDTFQDYSPLVQTTISGSQVRFIHDFFSEIVFLKRLRWPGAALREPLIRYVQRDGLTMKVLSRSKRTARFLLTMPYLLVGRYLFNRQARVFKGPPAAPRPVRTPEVARKDKQVPQLVQIEIGSGIASAIGQKLVPARQAELENFGDVRLHHERPLAERIDA